MATKTGSINIRIEPALRADAESVLDDIGMTISEAVTVFLKQVVHVGGLPFTPRRPRYRPETIAACMEAPDIAARGQGEKNLDVFLEGLKSDA